MGKILLAKPKPIFDCEVWEYKDRIVTHVVCGRCGEKFSMTLHCNPAAILSLPEYYKKARIFQLANQKHYCDEDSLVQDKAETNRIVNKYHETKRKLVKGARTEASYNEIIGKRRGSTKKGGE